MKELRVLDAARQVRDEVNVLLRSARPRLLYYEQLHDSAESIPANIREALGRRRGPERNQYFRVARSSAEETDEHLLANRNDGRITGRRYWSLHHKLVTIVKMLNRMMVEAPPPKGERKARVRVRRKHSP